MPLDGQATEPALGGAPRSWCRTPLCRRPVPEAELALHLDAWFSARGLLLTVRMRPGRRAPRARVSAGVRGVRRPARTGRAVLPAVRAGDGAGARFRGVAAAASRSMSPGRCGRCRFRPPPFARRPRRLRAHRAARPRHPPLQVRGTQRARAPARPGRSLPRLGPGCGRSSAERRHPSLVPIPLHRGRLLRRGYDQAALLTRALARTTGLPLEAGLLRRTRATRRQVGLTEAERTENVHGAFAVTGPPPDAPGAAGGRRPHHRRHRPGRQRCPPSGRRPEGVRPHPGQGSRGSEPRVASGYEGGATLGLQPPPLGPPRRSFSPLRPSTTRFPRRHRHAPRTRSRGRARSGARRRCCVCGALRDDLADTRPVDATLVRVAGDARTEPFTRIARPSAPAPTSTSPRVGSTRPRGVSRALGYLQDVYVLGGFDNEGKTGCDTDFGPEAKLDLEASLPGQGPPRPAGGRRRTARSTGAWTSGRWCAHRARSSPTCSRCSTSQPPGGRSSRSAPRARSGSGSTARRSRAVTPTTRPDPTRSALSVQLRAGVNRDPPQGLPRGQRRARRLPARRGRARRSCSRRRSSRRFPPGPAPAVHRLPTLATAFEAARRPAPRGRPAPR